MTVEDLVHNMLREEGAFQKSFRSILDEELNMSLVDLCRESGVSQSTMYKILEEDREPNLRTIRQVVKALNRLYDEGGKKFVAVIASPTFIESIPVSLKTADGRDIDVREYAVCSVEDAIIASVRAERDGALAVVCAPIIAPTIEKILSIIVSPIMAYESVVKALDDVSKRL